MKRRTLLGLALTGATTALVASCERTDLRQPGSIVSGSSGGSTVLRDAAGSASAAAGSQAEPSYSASRLIQAIDKLRTLHPAPEAIRPGDWLAEYHEPGQSFAAYTRAEPVRPELDRPGGRKLLHIEPLGPLTKAERRLVELTAKYARGYFGLEVVVRAGLPLSLVPASARRVHPQWGDKQLLTSYILQQLLAPRLPADAAAYISLTASDLWPGGSWNFVFGQATLRDRVGVWSLYRNGNPTDSADSFRLALLRTLKTAVHEIGHMFSLQHCIAHPCVMAGANNRQQSDRTPLWACAQCMAKICWLSRTDPATRYKRLDRQLTLMGLQEEAAFMRRSAAMLSS